MDDAFDLLVLGDLNPDVILRGQDLRPRFGQVEILAESGHLVLGGSGAITAVGAARLGLKVALCAVVGDDRLGGLVCSLVEAERVSTRWVRTTEETATGITVVLDQGSDRAMLTALGSIAALSEADLQALPDRPARHVHVASYHLMGHGYRAALPEHLERFRRAGVSLSLDPNWDPEERWQIQELVDRLDVLLPNRAELAALAGTDQVDDALASLGAAVATVAVKMGDRGGVCWSEGEVHRAAVDRPPVVVDAIGAGDSFDAGFLAGMLSGLPAAESLRLAVAAGTLSTRGVGGTETQPTRAEAWAKAGLGA